MSRVLAEEPATDSARETRASASQGRASGTAGDFPFVGLFLPIALALSWEAAVAAGVVNGRLMPPPSRILETLWLLVATGELWTHVATTTWRVFAGFFSGAAAGILIGAITGSLRVARRIVDPTLQGLRAIPSIAWVPLFILWFGIFETSKIALIATGVFFPVYLGVASAVLSVDRKVVEVGRAFRLSRPALVRRVLLPAVLPHTVTALRTGLGLGWMFVVAAEFMGASEGLGYLLVDGQQLGKADQIVAAILVFALLGKLSDWLLAGASAPMLAWQDRHEEEG